MRLEVTTLREFKRSIARTGFGRHFYVSNGSGTPGAVEHLAVADTAENDCVQGNYANGGKMAKERIRIKLKSFDHRALDATARKIVEVAELTDAEVSGPVPLPTEKEIVTILRSVFKHKDSREQFEVRTHKRLIDILSPNPKTVDALSKLELPAGVDINIKL